MPTATHPDSAQTSTMLALKEWGAVVVALLAGRQTVLLRKGGIRERGFSVRADRFVLFPTVAHAHAERVRPEHADLIAAGARELDGEAFVVRAGVTLVDVIEVARPEGLDDIADLHIWTPESVRAERLEFRPRHALQVLVVRAVELGEPVRLERRPEWGGCSSWVDLPVDWDGRTGRVALNDERLGADAERVRRAVG